MWKHPRTKKCSPISEGLTYLYMPPYSNSGRFGDTLAAEKTVVYFIFVCIIHEYDKIWIDSDWISSIIILYPQSKFAPNESNPSDHVTVKNPMSSLVLCSWRILMHLFPANDPKGNTEIRLAASLHLGKQIRVSAVAQQAFRGGKQWETTGDELADSPLYSQSQTCPADKWKNNQNNDTSDFLSSL